TEVSLLFVVEVLGSALGSPIPVLLWAMYADVADYGEWQSGRRATGLVFSASTMGQKVGWALGPFVAFQLLGSVGFAANTNPNAAVTASLVFLMSVAPAALACLSLTIFYFYPLTDERMTIIENELAARRANG